MKNALPTALGLLGLLAGGTASAQSLTVLPVNIEMAPGQLATTLTVINHGATETSVQVRALAWTQPGGVDELVPSDAVLASPPIATIPAGGTQVVRLVLRQPPTGQEGTYRILLDQIPPAAASGTVRIALRLSIPVFALPETRAVPNVQYRVETGGGQSFLVATNDGARHGVLHDIALATTAGQGLTTGQVASPYILAGTTRRWPIAADGRIPAVGGTVRLTARAAGGPVDETVRVVARP